MAHRLFEWVSERLDVWHALGSNCVVTATQLPHHKGNVLQELRSITIAIGLTSLATAAMAHAPIQTPWPGSGGGGVTQNVVAGPIKHRPVNNAPVVPPGAVSNSVELRPVPGESLTFAKMHVKAIFLGAVWRNAHFAQDKIEGIDQFLRNYSGSTYAAALSEYLVPGFQGIDHRIQYDGYLIDDQVELGRVSESKQSIHDILFDLDNRGLIHIREDGSSYYIVFSAHKRPSFESCGWHGKGLGPAQGGFYLSFVYDLDNDAQCDVADSHTGHSQGLASITSVAARALADQQTDVGFVGWRDGTGNEVDDLCAWTFSVPYVTFPDGSKWKLQDLWSNKAYEAGTGLPNARGQRGCVNGT